MNMLKRFHEWRQHIRREATIRQLKRDIEATLIAEAKPYKGEIRAVTFAQVKFVVYQLDGSIRFVARNLHATFGEIVENVCPDHKRVWEFYSYKPAHNNAIKFHMQKASLAYRLLKRFA